jgi:hypothetical protein
VSAHASNVPFIEGVPDLLPLFNVFFLKHLHWRRAGVWCVVYSVWCVVCSVWWGVQCVAWGVQCVVGCGVRRS